MEIVSPSDENGFETSNAFNTLMDISLNEAEEDALLSSRCKGRIQIELNVIPKEFWSRYLDFFLSHLKGRGAIGSVLEDGALLITFGVADSGEVSQRLVYDFAADIIRILGQSESDITEAKIHEMTDERLRRALADLGIQFSSPKLRAVTDIDI